jgi:hypothetical protein
LDAIQRSDRGDSLSKSTASVSFIRPSSRFLGISSNARLSKFPAAPVTSALRLGYYGAMDEPKSMPRVGWRRAVFDTPLRLVIAFALILAGIGAASQFSLRTGFSGDAAYSLAICFCMTPVALFYGYTYRRKPVWSPLLFVWLFGGAVALEVLGAEALGVEGWWAQRLRGVVGVVVLLCLIKLWPRLERALQRQAAEQSM